MSKANIWETELTQWNRVVRTLETYAGMPAPSMPHFPARVFGVFHRHALGDQGLVSSLTPQPIAYPEHATQTALVTRHCAQWWPPHDDCAFRRRSHGWR